jgi:hypothetical protein
MEYLEGFYMITFYNRNGRVVAYLDDDGMSIYLFNGHPAALLEDGSIYAYTGKYLGWFQDGWIFDRAGKGAFFTDDAQGGPSKPAREPGSARGARGAHPARSQRSKTCSAC